MSQSIQHMAEGSSSWTLFLGTVIVSAIVLYIIGAIKLPSDKKGSGKDRDVKESDNPGLFDNTRRNNDLY